MSVKTILPARNNGSAQTDNGWSPGIWGSCPIQAIKDGEISGKVFEFDFDTLPKTPATTEGNFGLFSQFSSTGGAIDSATGIGGGWVFSSDGDDEGASIRSRAISFQIDRTAAKKFWFEARIKTSTITDTKHNIICGMMGDSALTATVPITAAGAVADVNIVGFRRTEAASGGALMDTFYKADGVTAVTVQAGAVALTADTYTKLGMVYEPEVDPFLHDVSMTGVGRYNLFFYNNGIRLSSYKQIPSAQGTDFPNDVGLGFVFAVLNATASTPGNSTISRVRVAQVYSY